MKLTNRQISSQVRWHLKKTGIPKTVLARRLEVSMPTLYSRLKHPTKRKWTRPEIEKLHHMEIIYAPSCPDCGEIVDVLSQKGSGKKLVCQTCLTK